MLPGDGDASRTSRHSPGKLMELIAGMLPLHVPTPRPVPVVNVTLSTTDIVATFSLPSAQRALLEESGTYHSLRLHIGGIPRCAKIGHGRRPGDWRAANVRASSERCATSTSRHRQTRCVCERRCQSKVSEEPHCAKGLLTSLS